MSDADPPPNPPSKGWGMGVAFLLLVAAAAANLCNGKTGLAGLLWSGGREQTWLITGGLLLAALVAIGQDAKGRWDGVLIDETNRISLARFQLIVWTLVLVSALFTAGFSNIFKVKNDAGALAIHIPPQIWALLGLGALTAGTATVMLIRRGIKRAPSPRWLQLVMSDDHPDFVDVAKVQHLAFTVLLVCVYAASLWSLLSGVTVAPLPKPLVYPPIKAFPEVDGGFLALLAISHTVFLANVAGLGRRGAR